LTNSQRYSAIKNAYWQANTGEHIGKYFFLNFGEMIEGGSYEYSAGVRNLCESYGNPDDQCIHNRFALIDGDFYSSTKYKWYIKNTNRYDILYYVGDL
jgi:hypothetical protein